MKYVSLALTQPPEERNPMHSFVVETEGFEVSRLLEMNFLADGTQTSLFHVVGWPIEPYERALEATDAIHEYAISERPDETFYLYVHSGSSEQEIRLVEAAQREGLVGITPVEFRADGTIGFTVVGPGSVVDQALAEIPDPIGVDVESVGEYDARYSTSSGDLTERQFEAVDAAVTVGYYEEPRAGSVADVAAELDCAPGTAGELLRRAEARIMGDLVSGWSSAD